MIVCYYNIYLLYAVEFNIIIKIKKPISYCDISYYIVLGLLDFIHIFKFILTLISEKN